MQGTVRPNDCASQARENGTGSLVSISRTEHVAAELRALASKSANAVRARRMLTLAMVMEGVSGQLEATTLQIASFGPG